MKIQIKLFRPIDTLPNELQISKLDDNETYVLSYSISKFKKNIAIGIVEKFDQKYYLMSIIGRNFTFDNKFYKISYHDDTYIVLDIDFN